MNRLENGYRDIDPSEYFKMKLSILLSELGCDIKQIKSVLSGELEAMAVLKVKADIIRLIADLV
jgi:hypothetical protein